jgi:hypothetical protein
VEPDEEFDEVSFPLSFFPSQRLCTHAQSERHT